MIPRPVLASHEGGEALVDLIEGVCPGDEAVDVELALQVEADQLVEGLVGAGRAVVAADEGLLVTQELHHVDGGGFADVPEPYQDCGACLAEGQYGVVGGLRAAEAVEGHVHAAAGNLPDGLDWVLLARVHHVCRAELVAELQLVVVDVDGDYTARVE